MRFKLPPNTQVKDFGYPESHPLHSGTGESLRFSYQSTSISDSSDESLASSSSSSSSPSSSSLNASSQGLPSGGDTRRREGDETFNHYYNEDDSYQFINDEINCKARAIFDFKPENDNEIELVEGQIIWISYRHGQGWLVAEDPITKEHGLVPEEYVEVFEFAENEDRDVAKPFLPEIFRRREEIYGTEAAGEIDDDEWVDTDGSDGEFYSETEPEPEPKPKPEPTTVATTTETETEPIQADGITKETNELKNVSVDTGSTNKKVSDIKDRLADGIKNMQI
ncbi:HOG (high osmolarity glycerol) pathway protein [Lodderomyces elongisporus]|uniref:HOG (high osmolarity glycerol) pathway protein n=1 Tax=Lodderomyces elongisporus TaxID=36914 RepID=UPI002924623C|nr:HOG (high osmolarity glycerol) pathway protein [Lodderomyces elongisporus]WLF81424.1 HOG (high osmolarity glycerol) pathway protein [Lodderomyces elongisporus]